MKSAADDEQLLLVATLFVAADWGHCLAQGIWRVTRGQFFMDNFFSMGAKLFIYDLNVYKCLGKISRC